VQYNNSGSFGGAAALVYASSGNNLTVTAQNASDVPLLVKGAASQSGNLQDWKNSGGTALSSVDFAGRWTIAPSASTSGSTAGWVFTGAANTGQTTTAEVPDINFNIARTVTWAAGTVALQRFVRVQAPTMAFASASTCTEAVTFDIGGPPTAGTNATLTNAYSFRAQGQVKLVGNATGDIMLRMVQAASATGDYLTMYSSDGSTKKTYFDSNGYLNFQSNGQVIDGANLKLNGGQTIHLQRNGTTYAFVNTGYLSVGTNSAFVFHPNTGFSGSPDTILTRGNNAATLRLGSATASGTPVAQTIAIQDATGTNIAGATLTIQGGAGTGTGTPGSIIFQVPAVGSSGTTLQTASTRLTVSSTTVTATTVSTSDVNITCQAVSGQSGNFLTCLNSGAATVFSVTSSGSIGMVDDITMDSSATTAKLFRQTIANASLQPAYALKLSGDSVSRFVYGLDSGTAFISAGSGSATRDCFIMRHAAANWRLGAGASGTPVAQVLSIQDASGTNIAGVSFTFQGGRGTGTGTPGTIIFQVATTGSTGTTLQTSNTRVTIAETKVTLADAVNMALGTSTGTIFGETNLQKQSWWAATPVIQSTGWAGTNHTPTKTLDKSTATLADALNVLCTLLEQLKTYGLLGA